jgi:hypothetical protein
MSLWKACDYLGYCWDEWQNVRRNFLLGLFISAVALHLAAIAGAIIWVRYWL